MPFADVTTLLATSFGGRVDASFHNSTFVHPLGLTAIAVLGLALLLVKREWAPLPIIIMACLVSSAQRISLGGIDFTLLRIMVIFGFVRLLMRQEYKNFKPIYMDLVIILWAISSVAVAGAQYGSVAVVIRVCGTMYDALGLYFLFRILIRNHADFRRVGFSLAVIAVPVAIAFLVEHSTRRNPFAIFGGVNAITDIRQGRLRCQGAFSHPILAGAFWAAAIPLIAPLVLSKGTAKTVGIAGIAGSVIVIYACASSTPIAALGAGIFGACFFPLRHRLRFIVAGAVAMLFALHLVMKAPVWNLIARVDIIGGNTGNHRYLLIDNAIRHWNEWVFLGTPSTAHWGHMMHDVTNQYVLEGVRGGLSTMLLFMLIVLLAFLQVGKAIRKSEGNRKMMIASWAVGVALFVHATSFIAVSYFGQIVVIWYITLALAPAMAETATRERAALKRRRKLIAIQRYRELAARRGRPSSGPQPAGA